MNVSTWEVGVLTVMSNDPYFGYFAKKKPEENIIFGDFSSLKLGYKVIERSNPLPLEKRIIENIPFSDGVRDYSQILGKFFEERTITYTLIALKKNYEERKKLEIQSKQFASSYDYMRLFDSHDRGYYWKAKLESMVFTDDEANKTLTCQVSFKANPYMYRNTGGFNDAWDTFNFTTDVAQFYLFDVKRTPNALIIIPKNQKVEPTFELIKGSVTVVYKGYRKKLRKGLNATPFIAFEDVYNYLKFEGNGTVRIQYDIGVMG